MSKGLSSYKRQGKAPYQYSAVYRRWREAVRANRSVEEKDALSNEHKAAFVQRGRGC